MKIIKQPEKKTYERDENLTRTVMDILDNVRENGDKALIEYAAKFDKMDIKTVRVDPELVKAAYHQVDEATLEAIRFSTNPYNVNRLTLKAGQAALEDTAYFDRTRAAIVDTRAWTKQQLEQRGFAVLDSRSNFLFASTDRKDGGTLYKELKKNGILVRHFDAPRIQNWLRITIGTPEQMQTFMKTLDKIMEE